MESMDAIYRKYADYVYKYLMSLCHDPHVAEEVTQETFYQAIKGINKFDGRSALSTWLIGIAKNQYLVYHRKNPGHASMEDLQEESSRAESPEAEVLHELSRMELLKMIHRLDEPCREIFYLRLFEDMPFKDIGEIMGKSENWVRVTYYRGKEKLKKEIENHV